MTDPVTLTAIAAGTSALIGAGSLAYTALGPKPQVPGMPAAPPPAQTPTGSPTGTSTQGPSFLAAAAAPSGNQTAGQKSLLGQ